MKHIWNGTSQAFDLFWLLRSFWFQTSLLAWCTRAYYFSPNRHYLSNRSLATALGILFWRNKSKEFSSTMYLSNLLAINSSYCMNIRTEQRFLLVYCLLAGMLEADICQIGSDYLSEKWKPGRAIKSCWSDLVSFLLFLPHGPFLLEYKDALN